MKKKRGFSLVEIVVSFVLLAIGISAVTAAFLRGSYSLRQSENKSRAMSIASVKMEECLTKSFSGLEAGETEGLSKDGGYRWKVTVTDEQEGSIPYKDIAVQVFYREENTRREMVDKELQLKNIVVYPYIHFSVRYIDDDDNIGTVPYNAYASMVEIPLDFKVNKDLMIVYNVAIDVRNSSGLQALDTIYTRCFIDGKGTLPEARTPIMTQPLISNVVGVEGVSAGPHTLVLSWKKDTTASTVGIKEANIVIIATESD